MYASKHVTFRLRGKLEIDEALQVAGRQYKVTGCNWIETASE